MPLDSERDKVAEIFSLALAGIAVLASAAAASVPKQAWGAPTASGCGFHKCVLVPSSHIMRLLIAGEASFKAAAGATSQA